MYDPIPVFLHFLMILIVISQLLCQLSTGFFLLVFMAWNIVSEMSKPMQYSSSFHCWYCPMVWFGALLLLFKNNKHLGVSSCGLDKQQQQKTQEQDSKVQTYNTTGLKQTYGIL